LLGHGQLHRHLRPEVVGDDAAAAVGLGVGLNDASGVAHVSTNNFIARRIVARGVIAGRDVARCGVVGFGTCGVVGALTSSSTAIRDICGV
jgi:hypothetical protein